MSLSRKHFREIARILGENLADDDLINELDSLDEWPNKVKIMQQNWIGKSFGCEINFKIEDINKTSFPDSHFDIVFTRGVLIHIPNSNVNEAMNELFRISKKWIFNLEYFGADGEMINWKRGDDLCWYRNMKEKWQDYDVEVVTDFELPRQIDDSHVRFTLIKKKDNNY